MGWSFSHYENKQALVKHCVEDFQSAPNTVVLGYKVVGSVLYVACKYFSKSQNRTVTCIGVYLLKHDGSGRNYCNWGYKDMDESSHPYYYDCPLKLLDITEDMMPDSENARTWRAEVRRRHALKKAQKTIKDFEVGDKVCFTEEFKPKVRDDLKDMVFTVVGKTSKSVIIGDCFCNRYRAKAKDITKLIPKIVKIEVPSEEWNREMEREQAEHFENTILEGREQARIDKEEEAFDERHGGDIQDD